MNDRDRLLQNLPPYYKGPHVRAWLGAIAAELDLLWDALYQALDNSIIQLAGPWGLSVWEEILRLQPAPSMPLDQRRARALAKRRGATARLLPILEAMAPGLKGQWAGNRVILVLPQWADYDWGFMIPVLEQRKPAHLGYGFSVDPGDGGSGYLALAEHRARYRIHLEPVAGTLRAGRWPAWHAPGALRTAQVPVAGERRTGVATWSRTGTGQAGEFPVASTPGALRVGTARVSGAAITGVATWDRAGPGLGAIRTASIAVAGTRFTGRVVYHRCGTLRAGEVA